jgi:hypothetical protein
MTFLPKHDHWFLDMDETEARTIISLGHCKASPDCGCWWNLRLASAQQCAATLAEAVLCLRNYAEGARCGLPRGHAGACRQYPCKCGRPEVSLIVHTKDGCRPDEHAG